MLSANLKNLRGVSSRCLKKLMHLGGGAISISSKDPIDYRLVKIDEIICVQMRKGQEVSGSVDRFQHDLNACDQLVAGSF